MEFLEAPIFTRLLPRYLTEDEYRSLQLHLALDPAAGDVMPGTGGCRKLRWADRRRGKGKRGGLREAVDLSASERRLLATAIADEIRQRARPGRSRGGR